MPVTGSEREVHPVVSPPPAGPGQELSAALLDELREGCSVIGFDLTCLFVNDAAAKQARQPKEALVGRPVVECFPGIDRTPAFTALRDCLAQRKSQRLEQRHSFPDGSERWFELRLTPVPQGACTLSVDVTELRREAEARGRGEARQALTSELARTREEQAALEAQLADLIDLAPDGIFVADLEGRYTRVNTAACRMLGYAPEELLGKTIADLIPEEDVARLTREREEMLRGGTELGEWLLRHKDGHWVPVEVSAGILADGRWQAVVRDISVRKRAEEELRFAEALSSGILATSADAIVSIDEAQRITRFNEGAERIYGYQRAEVLGAPLELLIPPPYREEHRLMVERFLAGGEASRRMGNRPGRLFGLRRSGEAFPADAAISRLAVGGRVVLTVAVRDMTEQLRREQEQRFLSEAGAALGESLDYERTLSTVAHLAARELADVCAVNLVEDGGVRRLECAARDPAREPLCRRFSGIPLDRSRPHLLFETLTTRQAVLKPKLTAPLLAALSQSEEHRLALEALDPRSMITVPMVARGRLLGVIALLATGPSAREYGPADLALAEELARRAAMAVDNAQLYAAAQRAVEARDDLLNMVAHDLRNPLQGVQLQARVLRRHAEQGEAWCARPAELIDRAVVRMSRYVQDLLDVSRLEAGRLPLERVRLAAGPLAAEALEAHRALAAEAGVTLALDAPAELPQVEVDHHRLQQVFENLLGNALRYTPRGGRVTVTASARGGEVLFAVEDTGCGIPVDQLPRLFERFWQGAVSRRGAGLGLVIARGIVEAHGGRIEARSAPGAGTAIHFTLPAAPPSPA